MIKQTSRPQQGMALISGMLLLLVVTIIGLSMFRSFGIQARIAGNTREKQRALHTAEAAQSFAEWWLSSSAGGNATAGSECTDLLSVEAGKTQVCSNKLTGNVAAVPWKNGGKEVGIQYTPTGLGMTGADAYFQPPRFYIAYLDGTYDKATGTQVNSYRIDATGYGGNPNTASVVESAYRVSVTYTTLKDKLKFVSLSGP